MAQRRHNFISGAAVLAFAVAVTKVLGALYKIPLGNLLDKEGMAHFYAAYNIYNLLLVLSTAGLPLALSRLVSRAAAQGRRNAQRRIFRAALALLAVIGAVCSAVMCLFPQVLSGLLHDSLAAPAIRILGPAVLFVCLTSAIRGYTQGLGDMTPTAVSQMTESAGKLVIGLALCLVLLHRGADSSLCAAGAIARCVPERPSYLRLFARPVLITAVMALAARSSYGLLARSLPERWAVLPAIAVAVVVYGVLVLALGAVTRQDVLDLPKGEKIARMLHLH